MVGVSMFLNFRYCIGIAGKSQTLHKCEPVWYDEPYD